MAKLKLLLAVVILVLVLASCNLNNPPQPSEDATGYYSKELELSTWIDPAETLKMPVENRLYDELGRLIAVSKHTYTKMTEPGYEYYMVTRTDVYEVDTEGNQSFLEYYTYEYHPDYYEYIDEDGNEILEVDYLLLRGETYTADGILRLYYDTSYDSAANDGDFTTPDYDYYLNIVDKRDSDGESTAEQYATYAEDPDGAKHFRTEKFYVRKEDDSGLELSKEFASWYDVAAPYDYLYDLYHSFRGEGGAEEFYYFTRYSRNDTGQVYEQADYEYDAAVIPKISSGNHTNDTFVDSDAVGWPLSSYNYSIEFDKIGRQATVLKTEYDERGNITLDQRLYRGELIEYTKYVYDVSELTDKNRYTKGGSLLNDRKTVRFRDQVIYGKPYSVKEICEYKYYDYSSTEPQVGDDAESRGIGRMARPADSCVGLDELQMKHLQYDRLNNNYRK